jgi:hypothetical protein
MLAFRRSFVPLAVLLLGLPAASCSERPITAANLLAHESAWPYQALLTRDWTPEGAARPLVAGARAVLIRVEAGDVARLDFGRGGIHRVPVALTDLVERANRVRSGELVKDGPNFSVAIAQRLVDSAGERMAPLAAAETHGATAFLCVFADPDAAALAELAAAFAPLRDREGLVTILFAQGRRSDADVRERLRSLGWTLPFVFAHLSEPYTRTLIDPETPLPAVLLQSAEGRLLVFRGGVGGNPIGLARELAEALPGAAGGGDS